MDRLHYLLPTVLLAGCVYMGPLRMEEPIDSPFVVASRLVGSCPYVEGVYNKTPEVFAVSAGTGTMEREQGQRTYYAYAFPFNRVSTSESSIAPRLRESDFFEITQKSDDAFTVFRPRIAGDAMLSSTFSMGDGDFVCTDGRIVYPETRVRGGSEGLNYNLRTIRHLMRSENGELVFYEQSNSAGNLAHRFYVYPEKKGQE